jgi:TonB family protein
MLPTIAFVALSGQTQTPDEPCLAKGEKIYRPGEDKVKPPDLSIDRTEDESSKGLKVRAQLELVVNSKGHVCEVRVLRSDNHDAATQIADIVQKQWHFKPATRSGEPVSVRFPSNFTIGHQ